MGCPDPEMLLEMAEARLDGGALPGVEAHLDGCVSCREVVAHAVRQRRTASPAETAPPGIWGAPAGDPANYRLESVLSRGGHGVVWRAHDLRLDRTVALKQDARADPRASARFRREMRITARLRHPSIVTLHDVGTWPDGRAFYTMDLLEGATLQERIDQAAGLNGRLELLPNLIAVAEAIAFAHDRRIIHRDLKPANVLVGAFGETVVLDWGLAKDLTLAEEGIAGDEAPGAPDRTFAGTVLGTPSYMPPEQARGEPADERSDVYAIGAILYHLLAGAPPHVGVTSDEVLRKLSSEDVQPIEERQPDAPPDLAAIAQRALQRAPEARYPGALELVADLKRFTTGQLVGAHRYGSWALLRRWVRRHSAIVVSAAGALAAVLAIGAVSLQRIVRARQDAEEHRARAEARTNLLVLSQAEAVEERDPTAALAWLKQYPVDAPGWSRARELIARASARGVAKHVFVEPAPVPKIAVSPDGELVAGGRVDGVVRLWKPADGTSRTLTGHAGQVSALRFSPDGRRLLSAAFDKTVRLWELASGAPPRVLALPDVTDSASFSPDGKVIALAQAGGAILAWDGVSAQPATLGSHVGDAMGIAFSPDGRSLASAGPDKTVRIWDLAGGATRVLRGPESLLDVAFSPDGRSVAAVDEHSVRLWSLADGTLRSLGRSFQSTVQLTFVAGGRIAFGDLQGDVHLWSPDSDGLQTLTGHGEFVEDAEATADGRTLVTSSGRTVRVWPVPEPQRLLRLPASASTPPRLSLDGKWAAAGDYQGGITLWSLADGSVRTFKQHADWVRQIVFAPDGKQMASVDRGTLRIWDLASGQGRILFATEGRLGRLSFAGGRIVAGESGAAAVVLDGATGRAGCSFPAVTFWPFDDDHVMLDDGKSIRLAEVGSCTSRELSPHRAFINSYELSPDRSRIAVASADGKIGMIEVATSTPRSFEGHEGEVIYVHFSPDGRLLGSAGADTTIRLWDPATGAMIRTLRGHRAVVRRIAFSPDGERLASVDSVGAVRLWSVTGDRMEVYFGHENSVRGVEFADGGDTLVSSGSDGTMRLWPGRFNGARPNDPAQLHAWLARATSASIDADGRPATK